MNVPAGDQLDLVQPRCGAFLANGSTCWRAWAPKVRSVELLLYEHGSESARVEMQAEPGGYFFCERPTVAEGQRYAYRLDGGNPYPDPCSLWQPDGVHSPSAVLYPERMQWTEGDWSGLGREELVIYEMHVGTFTTEGTFDAVIPRLDTLRDLGITAIELMPVGQFPGSRGWGYDGVQLFAAQSSYGGPHGLQRLINACHCKGLGVILDVVYNHVGPEGNYLGRYGPYFTGRYSTPWGAAINFDRRGCDGVRRFVLDNIRYWAEHFRVDGFRLDAVHAILDFSPRHILREIKQVAEVQAEQFGRPVHVFAESNLNDVRLLDPIDRGGYGLDGQWNDDFHHCVHTLLTGERDGYYADFDDPAAQLVKAINNTFVYDGIYSPFRDRRHGAGAGGHSGDRFVISIQTHDQVGNRARGDRFGTLLDPAQQRLAAGLLLLSPYVPMLFMGEEYGETRPFPFFCSFEDEALIDAVRAGRRKEFAAFAWQGEVPDPQAETTFQSAKLVWDWPAGGHQAGLRQLYRDLLAARRSWPPLRDFRHRNAELVTDTAPPVLRLTRGDPASPNVLIVLFNLGGIARPFPAGLPEGYLMLLSSESSPYGGRRTADDSAPLLLPYEFRAYGPIAWKTV